MPPSVFLAVIASVLGSRDATVVLWALTVLLFTVVLLQTTTSHSSSRLIAVAVVTFSVLIALNNVFVSPSYTAAAIYHPLILCAVFFSLRRLALQQLSGAFTAAVLAVAGFAAWGLWQIASGQGRADAGFESANTFATVINLVLVPMLVVLLWRGHSAWRWSCAVLLAAALFATASRGGQLGLLAGLGAALVCARYLGLGAPRDWGRSVIALVIGVIASELLRRFGPQAPALLNQLLALFSDARLGAATAAITPGYFDSVSSESRLELYEISLDGLREHWLYGAGYLTFRYALERGRELVPSYGTGDLTYFAHNDYLQTFGELGIVGLVALLAVVVVPFWVGLRSRKDAPRDDRRVALVAALAAIASMAMHALVDFPFYVPACLALFGGALAVVDRATALPALEKSVAGDQARPAMVPRVVLLAIVILVGSYALLPLAAEGAARYGRSQFAEGENRSAAYWLELARRLEPRDWRYHWYAGQFWFAQAAAGRSPQAARLALNAFDAGFQANPNEPRNLLGEIETARRLHPLLGVPVQAAAFEAMSAKALDLAPLNSDARRERILALEFIGKRAEALRLAEKWSRSARDGAQFTLLAKRLRDEGGT